MSQYSGAASWTDPALWNVALNANWPDITSPSDMVWLPSMYRAGQIPFPNAMFKPATSQPYPIVQQIRQGSYNAEIGAWLTELLSICADGTKLVVTPYPEMNGRWVNYGPEPVPDFGAAVAIYTSIVIRGRAMGLGPDKVLWCWAPNDVGVGNLEDYWPGDEYVDIVGGSCFNWGGFGYPWASWQTPAEIIDPYVAEIRGFTDRPIIVTQTGAGEGDSRTPGWLDQLVEYTKGDEIGGFIWFSITEFTYQPGPADFNLRVASLNSDRPDHWFKEERMALSTSQMRTEWSEYLCNSLEWFTITVLNRAPVKTIRKLAEAWSAFERVMYVRGYGNAAIVSSYACRGIDGGKPSMHAFRLANDIDPALNWRQGSGATMDWSKCKLTRAQSDAVERICTNSGAQVFRNGWVFKNPDPMHFQIACTQADIESGIDWSTVEGDGVIPAPPPEYEEDDMFCKYRDGFDDAKGDDKVRHWQVKLIALDYDVGGPDGKYGDKTKVAVIAVATGSDGMQIGGAESGQIDVVLGKLGPMIPGGVEHQHEEYALMAHAHTVTGTAK